MRIAFFHELTPLSGARKAVNEYGRRLKGKHQVDLFYVDDKKDEKIKDIFNKVYFFEFKNKKWTGNDWLGKFYIDFIELKKLYRLHKQIAELIKVGGYDFVFVSPSKFTQAPFLLRMISKSVYFCQEPLRIVYDPLLTIPENINVFKKIYEKINRLNRKLIDEVNIRKAGIVLANSLFSKENIKKAYGINAYICYLGVDTKTFRMLNLKKEYDVLFIGEKISIEGFDIFEKSLDLFEDKPKVKYVSRSQSGLGIDENDLVKIINQAKIVVALSKSEPFGLIPIEAMACGVPVVAVSEGGFKESVINNKTGYLIKRDAKELKEKIDKILSDNVLSSYLGKEGRKEVEAKFTWEKSTQCFLEIVRNNL